MGFIRRLTGADAAQDAANIQAEASDEAIELARESRDQARADLSPFVDFGAGNIEGLQQILTAQGQDEFLNDNAVYERALANANDQTLNMAAARGRLGTGDTLTALSNNVLNTAQPLIDRQTNSLFNAVNMGQNSAAGQASTTLSSGANIGNLITGRGNALASGEIGASNARRGFYGSLVNLGAMAAGMGG